MTVRRVLPVLVASLFAGGCGDPAEDASRSGVDLVLAGSHGTEWDSMEAPVVLEQRCVSFGGVPAVFPEGSRVREEPLALTTEAGFEIALDGTSQRLVGDRFPVSGGSDLGFLDEHNARLLRSCAERLGATEFWTIGNMPGPVPE